MVSYFEVKEALRNRIATGAWQTGSRLPPERFLVREFGASRNTIRKAIRALAAEALISTSPNARPVVAYAAGNAKRSPAGEPDHERQARLSGWSILDSSPLEILEARLVIEPEAVAMAALRARSENIEEIERALATSLSAIGIEEFERGDGELHQAIFRSTRNSVLISYYEALNQIRNQPSWIALKKKSLTRERQRLYNRQHKAIVTAIVSRLPERAKAAMRIHLESVRKAMMI